MMAFLLLSTQRFSMYWAPIRESGCNFSQPRLRCPDRGVGALTPPGGMESAGWDSGPWPEFGSIRVGSGDPSRGNILSVWKNMCCIVWFQLTYVKAACPTLWHGLVPTQPQHWHASWKGPHTNFEEIFRRQVGEPLDWPSKCPSIGKWTLLVWTSVLFTYRLIESVDYVVLDWIGTGRFSIRRWDSEIRLKSIWTASSYRQYIL